MHEQPYTVLAADDDQLALFLLTEQLSDAGYQVVPAQNGTEALRRIEEEPVDLVILDVRMPGLSGFDVLRTLRQSHTANDLPVIMATAQGRSADMVEAFRLGATDYVTKPVDYPVMLARLQTHLRSHLSLQKLAEDHSPEPGLGSVLEGKYLLEEQIGKGHIGVVYRATHLNLHRPVAVKLLRAGVHADEDSLGRFRQEGKSTWRIDHPNAVEVLDAGTTAGNMPYLIMELLEGHDLAAELKRHGKLSPTRCAEILLPICEVLAVAHEQELVHRDIKPQNIFLHRRRHGEVVKVLDFGIAKWVGDARLNERLTQTGIGPGTPHFMAPERFSDGSYDGGADVYSLGVMLYQMLTGELPFTGNPLQIWSQHVNERPQPLRQLVPELPRALEAIVLQALAKDPARRPSAKVLGLRFAAALSLGAGRSEQSRPSRAVFAGA